MESLEGDGETSKSDESGRLKKYVFGENYISMYNMSIMTIFDRSLASSNIRSSLHSKQLRAQGEQGERGGRGAGEVRAPALGLPHPHTVPGGELLAT